MGWIEGGAQAGQFLQGGVPAGQGVPLHPGEVNDEVVEEAGVLAGDRRLVAA